MSNRRIFLLSASAALGLVLIVALIKLSKVNLQITVEQLENVHQVSFIKLLLLNIVLVIVSTEKWRSIDVTLRRSSDAVQSRVTSCALTSIGLVIGTVLPVQFAMSAARSLGSYFYGSAVKRGTLGTLYEHCFDVLSMFLLGVATLLTHLANARVAIWLILAAVLTVTLLIVVRPLVRLSQWIAGSVSKAIPAGTRIGFAAREFSALIQSKLLDHRLARRLVLLSMVRFAVVVLMSKQTAEAVGVNISIWHMAMAIPFMVMASVIALTPGGIGINEWTGAAALAFCGTPIERAAQWLIANRVLVSVSYFTVAVGGTLLLSLGKVPDLRRGKAAEGH